MGPYLQLLQEILQRPKHFQSDYCRYNAVLISEAASRGHITCVINGLPKGKWFLAKAGYEFMSQNMAEVIQDERL